MSDTKNDHEYDNNNQSTKYSGDLDYVTEEYYVEIVASTFHLSLTDIGTSNRYFGLSNSLDEFGINTSLKYLRPDSASSCLENVSDISKENLTDVATSALDLSSTNVTYSIGGADLNAGLDGVGINKPLGNIKIDPTALSLKDVNNIAKGYLIDAATSALGLSSTDVTYSIGGIDLNAGLDGIGINKPLGNIKIDPTASYLENVNNIAKGYLIDTATSALGLSSPDVSYSIGEIDLNAGLDGVGINTPLGNIKIDPTASCLENVNNIAKGYLIDTATSALGLSSTDVTYSIGGIDLNAGLDGVGINTPLGNIKIDPNASCTENVTNAVTELLGDSVNEEIDQFCSGFNDAARLQTDGSVYSDGTTTLLACQVNADAAIGRDGLKANAQADGSLSKHKLGDADISVGQGQAYAKASIGADGVKAVVGGEINAVSFEHKNVQAKIGLSVKTGVEASITNISASVLGVGLNAGTDGVGINTPTGSLNVKLW
ncbi:unnamed protein product [Rotaria sp. Silwood2]|nr:unnamed protein product [Rotaria sp. Silwood2]